MSNLLLEGKMKPNKFLGQYFVHITYWMSQSYKKFIWENYLNHESTVWHKAMIIE